MHRPRCTTIPKLACVAMTVGCGASPAASAEPAIDAIWSVHSVELTYKSLDVYYSCSGLQSKIAAIMRAIGAQRYVAVEADCLDGQFVNSAYARVIVVLPTEATEENVQAATNYDTRLQLVARLRQIRLPTANDIERFPATWRTVSLTRNRRLGLEPGDCDLLQGIYQQVFPHLPIRTNGRELRCAGPGSRMRPQLEVTALMPERTPVAYNVQ